MQLLGYRRVEGELLLIYGYMANGSLDKYLHCGQDEPSLNWAKRFNVAKELHVACSISMKGGIKLSSTEISKQAMCFLIAN